MFITKLHSQLKICSIFLLTIALIKLSHANENEENVDEDGEESGATEAIEGEKGKGNESGDQAYYTDAQGNPVTYGDEYGYEDGEDGQLTQAELQRKAKAKEVRNIFNKHPHVRNDILREELARDQMERYIHAIISEVKNHRWDKSDNNVHQVVPIQPNGLFAG